MSQFFNKFPYVNYKFGDEVDPVLFQKLSSYVDIVDQIKNAQSFYNKYFIQQGERPDTLSYKLYGSVDYYWLFYLMNDNIRLSGWPLSNGELMEMAKLYYPNKTVVTKDPIHSAFLLGSVVSGSASLSQGVVVGRNIDLGQLVISTTMAFQTNETLSYLDETSQVTYNATVYQTGTELESVHHYELDGVPVDIDPSTYTLGVGVVPVTLFEHLSRRNEELKQIVVLKPDQVNTVAGQYMNSMGYK